MKNSIAPIAPSAHAMTQNDGINPNSRWGKLMAAAGEFDGDTEDYSRDVDAYAARVDALEKRMAEIKAKYA